MNCRRVQEVGQGLQNVFSAVSYTRFDAPEMQGKDYRGTHAPSGEVL